MAAARLGRRLLLEEPVATPDGAGGREIKWRPRAALWAEVAERQGREREWAEALTSEGSFRIRIRYRSDVGTDMRFRERSRVYAIRSVFDPDGRRRWLVCTCTQKPA